VLVAENAEALLARLETHRPSQVSKAEWILHMTATGV
jgi:hypothetical protein